MKEEDQVIKMHCSYDKLMNIEELKPKPNNSKLHDEGQIKRLPLAIWQ